MARDQREIITKKQLAHSFSKGDMAGIIGISVTFFPILLLFLLFAFIVEQTAMWLIWGGLVLFYIFLLVYYLFQYRRDKHGLFLFVKDTLIGIAEYDRLVRRGRSYRCESAFYFAEHGRVVVGREDIRLSSHGDEFFLVLRADRKKRVLSYFNMKYYCPEELDG